MGRSFRAPRADNREQWLKVQLLFAYGFGFFGSGFHGGPPLPGRLREVQAFVGANLAHPLRVAAIDRELLRTSLGRTSNADEPPNTPSAAR
jgi:hypothetical protein